MRDYQESELAPLILDQVKQLKEAIASENIDQINNSNTIVDEFINEKFIKPEELCNYIEQSDLKVIDKRGFVFNFLKWNWNLSHQDLSVNFVISSIKN